MRVLRYLVRFPFLLWQVFVHLPVTLLLMAPPWGAHRLAAADHEALASIVLEHGRHTHGGHRRMLDRPAHAVNGTHKRLTAFVGQASMRAEA